MINVFDKPYMFLLLILLGLVLAACYFKKMPSIRVPSLTPFRRASGGKIRFKPWKELVPFLLYALAGVMIVIALAAPREGIEEIRRRADGIDIMIAIDLSGSMRAIDVPPGVTTKGELDALLASKQLKDRLETAKDEVKKFILARPSDRIGLIAFAPLPYVVCPPTLDHSWLIANLERLESGSIGDNTGIAGPVASATKRLKDSNSKRKIIVLFTDGRNNVNAAVTPRQAAKLADSLNVTLYTVGIGSSNSLFRQETPFGTTYEAIRGEFDEELLKEMASITKGVYYHASDAGTMAKAMSEIDKLEKTSVEQNILINYREFYPLFTALAIAFLCAGFVCEHALWPSIP